MFGKFLRAALVGSTCTLDFRLLQRVLILAFLTAKYLLAVLRFEFLPAVRTLARLQFFRRQLLHAIESVTASRTAIFLCLFSRREFLPALRTDFWFLLHPMLFSRLCQIMLVCAMRTAIFLLRMLSQKLFAAIRADFFHGYKRFRFPAFFPPPLTTFQLALPTAKPLPVRVFARCERRAAIFAFLFNDHF